MSLGKLQQSTVEKWMQIHKYPLHLASWHIINWLVDTNVLFICKTKSRLRRRHCGLARHFKTDPTETVALCFGYANTLFWRRRHCGLARHFKTDPTKTVALCFGYAKTLCWQLMAKQMNRTQGVYIIRWDFNEGFLFHVAHRKYLPLDGARIR
jgi:hypothetical protein